MNARYQNPTIGKFVSQDPLVITSPEKFLSDPQQMNYYSYARNNPIINTDPTGQFSFEQMLSNINGWTGIGQAVDNSPTYNYMVAHPVQGGAMVAGASALALTGASEVLSAGYTGVGATELSTSASQIAGQITSADVIRAGAGAAANLTGQFISDKVSGKNSSAATYVFAGTTGLVAGPLAGKAGLFGTAAIGGFVNYTNQKFAGYADNQPFSGTSVGISTATSLLTSGIMSNVPAGAASPAATEWANSALNWVIEQPPQIVNSATQKNKGK